MSKICYIVYVSVVDLEIFKCLTQLVVRIVTIMIVSNKKLKFYGSRIIMSKHVIHNSAHDKNSKLLGQNNLTRAY